MHSISSQQKTLIFCSFFHSTSRYSAHIHSSLTKYYLFLFKLLFFSFVHLFFLSLFFVFRFVFVFVFAVLLPIPFCLFFALLFFFVAFNSSTKSLSMQNMFFCSLVKLFLPYCTLNKFGSDNEIMFYCLIVFCFVFTL